MEERGLGYVADMLVFALLTSTAIALLTAASPVDSWSGSTRYAASFAQSTLLSLQNSTADQFGGFEYTLGAFGFEMDLPVIGDSAKRELRHKTLAQLLAEDALLNMRVEVGGTNTDLIRPNEEMDNKLKELLRYALDRIIGWRFGYYLHASSEPIDLGFLRVHFETEIRNLTQTSELLYSECTMLSIPVPREDLIQRVEEALSIDLSGLELDPIIDVRLELWSK